MQSRTEIDNLQQQSTEQQTLLAASDDGGSLCSTDVSYLETIARDRLDLMKEARQFSPETRTPSRNSFLPR